MLPKFLTTPSKSITGAAVIISLATLLSRAVGIGRDHILAHYYGGGPVIDAYYAAFKVPDLIYNLLIVGALTAGFIPTFTKLFNHDNGKPAAWRLASNILNIIGVALICLSSVGMICSPWIAKLIAPGFNDQNQALVTTFTRILFLSPVFLGISMVMGGILQSLKNFLLYSFAPVFYNLGIILGATVFVPMIGISGLAWGVVLGAFMHCLMQTLGAWQAGYRWKKIFNLRDSNTRLVGRLMVPRTLGLAITQFNTVIVTILASLLPIGSVAAYNYANNLQGVATGLIGIPFALAVFPVLSAAVAENNQTEFSKNISLTARQILFLIVPASIVILLLRAQIVRTILGSGQFSWTATITTANALAFFAFGLFAQCLIPLIVRGFYALSDTRTPFVIGVISELISIICALLLMRPLGVSGLALATSIGATLNLILLVGFLRAKMIPLEGEKITHLIFKLALAGIPMALVIQYLKTPLADLVNMTRFWGILIHGVASGTVGLLVYCGICYVLQVDEMRLLTGSLKKRWLKLRPLKEGMAEL